MRKSYKLQDSEVEWLGKIPVHWKIDRLKDVSQLRSTKIKEKSSLRDYLELEDLEKETGRLIRKRNSLGVASQMTRFYKGDVLFGKLRPYLAKYHLSDFDGKCTGEILVINPTRIFGGFLAYYISSVHFINHCNNNSYGAKMPRINWNTQMGAFPMPVPHDVREQKSIAAYLDQACIKVDESIAVKKQQLKVLTLSRNSIIQEAVTKGITKQKVTKKSGFEWFANIPVQWKIARLKFSLTKVNSGVTPKGGATSYVDEGIPLIRSQNVKAEGLDLSDVVYIPKATHDKMRNSKVRQGDLLLNITGASIGRCAVVGDIGEANVNQHVCILRFYPWVSAEFIYYFMISPSGQAQIFSSFTGSGREGLNFESIKKFHLPLPKFSEQKAISEHLDAVCKKLDDSKNIIQQQIDTLTNYRKSLVHECVTGKKRVYFGQETK